MPDPHCALPTPKAAALLAQAADTVRLAHALASAGRTVELTGLDELVGVACAHALDVPPHEGQALRPALVALLRACDALNLLIAPNPRQKAEPCFSPPQHS